jgi:hypothetical protein
MNVIFSNSLEGLEILKKNNTASGALRYTMRVFRLPSPHKIYLLCPMCVYSFTNILLLLTRRRTNFGTSGVDVSGNYVNSSYIHDNLFYRKPVYQRLSPNSLIAHHNPWIRAVRAGQSLLNDSWNSSSFVVMLDIGRQKRKGMFEKYRIIL